MGEAVVAQMMEAGWPVTLVFSVVLVISREVRLASVREPSGRSGPLLDLVSWVFHSLRAGTRC
jgi:hypothetical protein